MADKPEQFFDFQGRQDYLTAREHELRRAAARPAPTGEVIGYFFKSLASQLGLILVLIVVTGVLTRLEDGNAGWQSPYMGAMLMLIVPLAGTVWTLGALGKRDFSGTPGPGAMRLCAAIMTVAFIAFILACVWVLSLIDPVVYDSSTVSQLAWAAFGVTTTIVGLAFLMLWLWRFPLGVVLTLAFTMLLMIAFVGLLPLFQGMGHAWPGPLLLGLRFIGPVLLVFAITVMPTNRALLVSENDPVEEFIDRAAGDFDPRGPAPKG